MLAVKNVSLASPSETSTGEKRKRDGKIRSKVWDHFTKVENKPECVCNHCKRVLSCATNGGTTHLKRHIFWRRCKVYNEKNEDNSEKCLSDVNASLEQESEFIRKKFDQERSWRDLTELIIKWELPFNLVEDPTFQKYVRGICPKYKFLSWDAIRNGCVKQYETEKKFIKDILGRSKPRVCLTTETWTSSKNLRYMGLRVHFIDNGWELHTRIIKFAMVPVEESGENLADIISSCLLEWNIDKICTITLGNCITNDVLARCLVEHYSSRGSLLLQGRAIQVRCWGHVLNLIVQEGFDEIKDSICRVRNAVKYVKLSPRRKIDFLQYADQEGISRGKMLILDLSTQWDTTYKMLGSALHYQRAYDRMRSRDPHFKYPPTPEDWEKAKIIHRFLKTFSVVTKTLSGAKGCTANVFFYEVCKILTYLRDAATDLGSILGRLALNVLEKFERYWIEKEPNILLSIAVVLDPRFKLQYLRFCYNKIYDSSLVGDLMGRVEDEFRKLFDEYAAQYEASCKSSDECTSSVTRTSSFKYKTNFMGEFYDFSGEEDIFQGKAELDVYLEENLHRSKTPSDEEEFDILQWWKVNSSKFPVLSRMAHDILAIPVSSIPSKCGFSADGRVLNKFQSSLLPSTIEALVCTQDWIQGEKVQTEFEEEIDTHFSALNISQDMDSE